MMKPIKLTVHFFVLFTTASCLSQNHSPTDQLINGPINISTEWQTVIFDKSLKSAPYAQYIELLSCEGQYEFDHSIPPDQKRGFLLSGRFKRITDSKILEPEVIVSDGKYEYKLSYTTSGYYHSGPAKNCRHVGYSIDDGTTAYYLPEKTKFVSVKIRANTSMKIDHLYWVAPSYEKAPNATWENTHPSKIITLEPLALKIKK